nr:serine hydrolase [Bacteroidota bacterium]
MKNRFLILSLTLLLASQACQHDIDDKTKRIDELISFCHETDMFNGAVLVARNGEVIYKNALGYADLETRTELTTNSIFNIGSVTKQFTAMALMILKEKGKLSLDDQFSKYFPGFPNAEKFTIRNLLNHTAGIPEWTVYGSQFRVENRPGDFLDGITANDVYNYLLDLDSLDFKPGEKYDYSNSGYVLLQMLVEKVSGLPFHQFLQDNIFIPMKMKNTLVWNSTKSHIPQKTTAYNEYGDRDDYNILVAGDGGIYSTIEDLFKWDQALYSDRLVSFESITEAFSPGILNNGSPIQVRPGSEWGYGFGWLTKRDGTGDIVFHDGGFNGFSSYIYRDMNKKDAIILLSNKGTNGPLYPIQERILNILNNEPFTYHKIPVNIKLKNLIDSVGADNAIAQYHVLKSTNDTHYNFDINQLNRLGYYYLYIAEFEHAKAVFRLNLEEYPEDANVYDSYAESFMLSGDFGEAVKFYQKSLELNPKNENAVEMLKKINHTTTNENN